VTRVDGLRSTSLFAHISGYTEKQISQKRNNFAHLSPGAIWAKLVLIKRGVVRAGLESIKKAVFPGDQIHVRGTSV
jgi:hypothetical protein